MTNYPMTNYPTTNYPTTNYPMTNYPTTNYPTTNYPTTNYPTTNYPTTNYPTTNYPTTNYPTTTHLPRSCLSRSYLSNRRRDILFSKVCNSRRSPRREGARPTAYRSLFPCVLFSFSFLLPYFTSCSQKSKESRTAVRLPPFYLIFTWTREWYGKSRRPAAPSSAC